MPISPFPICPLPPILFPFASHFVLYPCLFISHLSFHLRPLSNHLAINPAPLICIHSPCQTLSHPNISSSFLLPNCNLSEEKSWPGKLPIHVLCKWCVTCWVTPALSVFICKLTFAVPGSQKQNLILIVWWLFLYFYSLGCSNKIIILFIFHEDFKDWVVELTVGWWSSASDCRTGVVFQ